MTFKIRRWRIYACLKIEFSNSKVSLLYFWKVKSFHLGMLIKEEKVKVAQNRLRHLINVRSTSFYKKETKASTICSSLERSDVICFKWRSFQVTSLLLPSASHFKWRHLVLDVIGVDVTSLQVRNDITICWSLLKWRHLESSDRQFLEVMTRW